ncbi:MAG: heme exporter protein CcmD [Alphaproteobacteria bacterium]|nr:heme exporter protein CcmD [Alphaproteobacteria bacterium]
MDALGQFLAMGGYGAYVWPAYAIALVVLAGILIASVRTLNTRRRAVAALEAALPRRRRQGGSADDA